MRNLVWLAAAASLYLGVRSFLNVIGVLQTSKYSEGATAVFAIVWLSIGLGALYATTFRQNARLGLAISVGPWVLLVLVMFVVLATGNPQ